VGPRADLDAVAKRKKSHHCSYRELNPGRPARNLVTILTTLCPDLETEGLYSQFEYQQDISSV